MASDVVQKARELRKNQTPEEQQLWYFLRDKRFAGFKFRRQHPIGEYIADFCCPEKKLVIELDGAGHTEASQKEYDSQRDDYLRSRGYKVIRIRNGEVRQDRDEVLIKLLKVLKS